MKNAKRIIRMTSVIGFLSLFGMIGSFGAWAAGVPDCMDQGQRLEVENGNVIEWKQRAPLGVPFRARVEGRVTRVFPDRNGHAHFEIQICSATKARTCDVLEVVYSEDFGAMPDPAEGAVVEACGDFINAYDTNNGYPPSPSGALIHWVHRSNSARHAHGYVILENVLYGFGADSHPRQGNEGGGHRRGGRGGRDH